jgi:hypothetical protein
VNLRQPVTVRTAIVVVLVVIYAAALVALIVSSRKESAVAVQVRATEASIVQATSNAENTLPVLQANLEAAKEKLATLESRVPGELTTDVFDAVAQDAQLSGISGFRYERKGEFQETLQSGTYKVYRFAIAGRGSQERISAFLDGLQAGSGPTMIVENVNLSAVDKEWQMSADIIVYTLGA